VELKQQPHRRAKRPRQWSERHVARNARTDIDEQQANTGEIIVDTQTKETRRGWRTVLGRRGATAAVAAGLAGGAFAGGYLISHAATTAASPSTSSSASASTAATTPTPAPGTFHSNENASHEAGESAAREAQENAGQMPTVP
jgi:hypothetical protein